MPTDNLAFHREDLADKGVLKPMKSYIFGFRTLTNETHPIFSYEHFSSANFPSDEHRLLRPMFQLCSRFIIDDQALEWWVSLILGNLKLAQCHPTHKARLVLKQMRPSQKNLEKTKRAFEEMAGRIHFDFKSPLRHAWACTRATDPTEPSYGSGSVVTISLSPRFLDAIKETNRRQDAMAAMRLWLLLAQTITQELAHAIRIVKMQRVSETVVPSVVRIPRLSFEPFFKPTDPNNNLGEAWSHFMFGGTIGPINDIENKRLQDESLEDCIVDDGLSWMRWMSSRARMEAQLRGVPVCAAVSMDGVLNWWRENVWERVAKEGLSELTLDLTNMQAEYPMTYDMYFISNEFRKGHFRAKEKSI